MRGEQRHSCFTLKTPLAEKAFLVEILTRDGLSLRVDVVTKEEIAGGREISRC
jgi:hypothetical protein